MSELNHKPSYCREDLPFIIYLCLSTLYLGAQMFQGLSFLDIGMYMSGYEHIASDPYPSVFLGQWLLSFTVSSCILRLFHADSFLAMRLMFLVFSVIMQVVAYISCKRYVPRRYVIAGLALTVLSIFGAYTEMTYNDYTALLFMAALLSYHNGQSSSLLYIAISGFLIALAFFFRITNLAFVVFPLAAWLMGRLVPWGVHPFRLQALTFAAGWVVGFALTFLLVIATGYGDIMAFTLQSIINIGGNSADAHNMKAILRDSQDRDFSHIRHSRRHRLHVACLQSPHTTRAHRHPRLPVLPHHGLHLFLGTPVKHNHWHQFLRLRPVPGQQRRLSCLETFLCPLSLSTLARTARQQRRTGLRLQRHMPALPPIGPLRLRPTRTKTVGHA